MSKNRHPIVQWSLTFPRWRESKEECKKNLPPYKELIIAREEHDDKEELKEESGYHLHVGMILKKGITFSNMKKWMEEKYPEDNKRIKFEPVKNWKNWIDYCRKEDPKPLIVKEKKPMEKWLIEAVHISGGRIVDGVAVWDRDREYEFEQEEVKRKHYEQLEREHIKHQKEFEEFLRRRRT